MDFYHCERGLVCLRSNINQKLTSDLWGHIITFPCVGETSKKKKLANLAELNLLPPISENILSRYNMVRLPLSPRTTTSASSSTYMRLSQSPSYLNDGNNNTYDRYDKIIYDENSNSSIGNRNNNNNSSSDERIPSSRSSSYRPFDSPSSSALKSGYVRSLRSSFEPNNSSSSSSSRSSSLPPSSSRTSRPYAIDVELPAVVASRQRDYRRSNVDRVPREDSTNDNSLKNEYAHSSQIIRGHMHSQGGNVNLNSIQVDIPLPPSNVVSTHQHDSINDSKKKKKAKKVGVKVDDYINHINSQRSASLSLSSSHSTSTSSFDTTHLVTRERYQLLFHKRQSQLEQRMKMQLYDLQQEQAAVKTAVTRGDVGDRRVKKNYNNDPTATAKESGPSLLHEAIQERRFVPNNNSPTWMGLLEQKRNNNTLLLLQESVVNEESAKNDNVGQSITPRNGSLDIILPSSSSSSRSPIIRIVDDRAWQGAGKTPTKLSKGSDDAATTTMTRAEVEHKAGISKTTNDKKNLLSSFVESNNDKILPTYSTSSESESLMYSLGEDTDHSVDHEQRRLGMSMQSLTTAIQNASELFMSDDDSENETSRETNLARRDFSRGGVSGSYSSLPSTRSSRTAGGGWNDLVASTLAECKLLLNLSPLPSPAVVSKVNVHVKSSDLSPLSSPASKDNKGIFDFLQRHNEQRAMANNPQPPSENDNMSLQRIPFSMTTMSIIATCPTCFKDFDMEGGDNMPVDSSRCEHIICRACILDMQAWTQLNKNTGISCPECGMKGAFDIIHQPTDSQESIGLVVTTIDESIKTKDMLQVESSTITVVNDEINVNDVSIQTESNMERDQTVEKTSHLLDTAVVNEYQVPLTPVSQAESHILERRERLVQSFGKLNKILDSVKQVPNENQPATLTVHNHTTTMVHEKESIYVVPMTKNESRRMPQLRVDTGNEESPHAAVPQMVGGVINTAKSIMSLFSPVQVSSFLIDADKKQKARSGKTERVDSLSLEFPSPITDANICSYGDYNSLKFANAPESIEFDCFIAATMSNDSSLTDNDTILLLADKRPSKHLPEEVVSKENHNRVKNVIGRQITCPQFLPSLRISTEQDHALINDAFPGSSKNGEAQTERSAKGGGPIVCLKEFVIRSFGFGDSPRHIEFSGGSSFSSSPYNKEENMVDNDITVSGTFPTYEFSLHSCSMSPTLSQDDQFWQNNTIEGGEGGDRIGDGSLVTHKPRRLHKKIMNKLRIKKSRYSFM